MGDSRQQQDETIGPDEAASMPLEQRDAFRQFMRECQACQEEIEPHWQACAHCGTRLDTPCPGCGIPLPPAGAQACPHCGLAIPPVDA